MWVRLFKESSYDKETILSKEDLGRIDVNQWIPLETFLSWRFNGMKFSKPMDSDKLVMKSDWVQEDNKFHRILAITMD